jgi:hypothetical protein
MGKIDKMDIEQGGSVHNNGYDDDRLTGSVAIVDNEQFFSTTAVDTLSFPQSFVDGNKGRIKFCLPGEDVPLQPTPPSIASSNSYDGYEGLEDLIEKYCNDQKHHVFLHPSDYGISAVSEGLRKSTMSEMAAIQKRDFETRLFVTAATFEGDSVFLRTRFSDNHIHKTKFNNIRDYFKAAHATRNFTAAKSTLAEILTTCMETDKDSYYSFAVTVASGLSKMGGNTSFEINRAIVSHERDIDLARRKLCLLMHIIFAKMETSKFLVDEGGTNIYRVVHCKKVVAKGKRGIELIYPVFTFALQLCLTIYVCAGSTQELLHRIRCVRHGGEAEDCGDWDKWFWGKNAILATFTLIYSILVALPEMKEYDNAFNVYNRRIGTFQMLDFFVNTILPPILLVFGFLTIMTSESFIESVLNTAALLFIPEIDDQLPKLLGYNSTIIFKNYLTHESLKEFDRICKIKDTHITKTYLNGVNSAIGVQFSDFYLTNWPEQGSTSNEGIHFKPYQILKGKIGHTVDDRTGAEISPTNHVNENCLIKKIVWRYTTGFEDSIKPRIGYLRFEMVNGEEIEFNTNTVNEDLGVDMHTFHSLKGVFIITTFQISSSILRLRMCGSYKAKDFISAFDYYSLWNITDSARSLLKNHRDIVRKIDSYESFRSSSSKLICSPTTLDTVNTLP